MVEYTKLINTELQFTDQSSNNPTSWLWNFGDGTTSTLQNPKKTYTTKGTYTVTLTTSNTCGNCSSITKIIEITEPSCTPKWQVGAWGACQPNGLQTRTVTDLNNCNTTIGKPITTQACIYSPCVPSWTCIKDNSGNNTGIKSDGCGNTQQDLTMCPLPSQPKTGGFNTILVLAALAAAAYLISKKQQNM